MKISIITAVLNREDTIGDCISSLYSQVYQNFEHIVIDGGSTDATLATIREFDDQRAIIYTEQDNGVYEALNKGLSRASGDVIGFLHSDDFLSDNRILSMIAETFIEQQCDIVYGNLNYVMRKAPSIVIRHWKSGNYARWKLRLGWMPPHPTFFIHRRVLDKVNQFDSKYKISCDYDFMMKCLFNNVFKVHYIDHVMVMMRVGGLSNRSFKQMVKKSMEDLRIIRDNRLSPRYSWVTLLIKNIRKIPQFIFTK